MVIFTLLLPEYVKSKITPKIIGQGLEINNFSKKTKSCKSGSKKASIASPYSLAKDL